jgi:hypothetical protein
LVEVIIAFAHRVVELDSHLPILLPEGRHVSRAQGCRSSWFGLR